MSYNYDVYRSDLDKVLYSAYYHTLGYKTHSGTPGDFSLSDAGSFSDGKMMIMKDLAERYSANEKFCEIMLGVLDLATPPLGEAGLKFMTENMGIKKQRAAIAIAEELELSPQVVNALEKYDDPETNEGDLVQFVQENFDAFPELTLEMINAITKDILENSNDNMITASPEMEKYIDLMAGKKESVKMIMREKEIYEKIEEKLEGEVGMAAALKFIKLTDLDFGYNPYEGE